MLGNAMVSHKISQHPPGDSGDSNHAISCSDRFQIPHNRLRVTPAESGIQRGSDQQSFRRDNKQN